MKIILIKPRYFDKSNQTFWRSVIPPMGLARLAGFLIKHRSDEVKIFDMEALEADMSDLEEFLLKERPSVVGVDFRTPLIRKTQAIARLVRKLFPEVVIVVGGPHTFLPIQDTLNEVPEADYVLRGEAEYTFKELLDCLEKKTSKNRLKRIAGIMFRDGKKIFVSRQVPRIEDLDKLAMPAHQLLPLDKYLDPFVPHKRLFSIMTTRGCPYNCSFCTEPVIYGRKVRARSVKNVADEVEILVKEHGVDYIIFHDATFNYHPKRVKALCREFLKRDLNFKWKVKARVDQVDLQMLKLMKKAGCQIIGFGVEAGTEKALKVLNKGYTLKQVKRAFELAKKANLETLAYFMIGTYGETKQDVMKTIDLSIKLKPTYAHYMTTTPMPGSKMYAENKQSIRTDDWADFYFYNAIVNTRELSWREIKKLHRLAHLKFYLRPSYIIDQLLSLKSLTDFKLKFKMGLFFLTRILS
ncbi:B12-binding domain-containing radical SAM protein [Patescibacteria group bacterium]